MSANIDTVEPQREVTQTTTALQMASTATDRRKPSFGEGNSAVAGKGKEPGNVRKY